MIEQPRPLIEVFAALPDLRKRHGKRHPVSAMLTLWGRDVTFDEDRSHGREGHIPQVMAAHRNTAIGLLRWAGDTNIAAACRQLAAQPAQALALVGIALEN
jgi:hypothetical protein